VSGDNGARTVIIALAKMGEMMKLEVGDGITGRPGAVATRDVSRAFEAVPLIGAAAIEIPSGPGDNEFLNNRPDI
jgi:hypothetical protein